jgi:outer membrane lipoprotein-sorting protein
MEAVYGEYEGMNMKLQFCLIGVVLYLAVGVRGLAQVPSGSKILQNVERTTEDIQDFTVTIEANVNMERVRVPKMAATLYFKKPDKIHFTSQNFVMVPREGIVVNPSLLRERYNPVVLGEDTIEGKKLHKLQLTAKDPKARSRQMLLWIEPSNWTIARMETIPYQGRFLRLAFTYGLEQGKYWLPQTLHATFENVLRDSTKRTELDMPESPQWNEMQRPLRSGSITVTYSNYKVNVGLSDEIFERRDRPVKE